MERRKISWNRLIFLLLLFCPCIPLCALAYLKISLHVSVSCAFFLHAFTSKVLRFFNVEFHVHIIHHHHHHVQEGLGLIPVPFILKMKLVPPSLPPSSYVSSSFGFNCSACLGILFVSILCMCCSHFSWYCFISFTIFSAPVFSLIHRFFSLSNFFIPRKCLKNFYLCCF